jgi:hypothetical protein
MDGKILSQSSRALEEENLRTDAKRRHVPAHSIGVDPKRPTIVLRRPTNVALDQVLFSL